MRLKPRRLNSGFAPAETVIAMAVFGIVACALMTGIIFGVQSVGYNRDCAAATQVLNDKMETLRLVRWENLDKLPKTFQDGKFSGQLEVFKAPFTCDYSDRLRWVRVGVSWNAGSRYREWSTWVSREGMQNYIENPKQQPEKPTIKI